MKAKEVGPLILGLVYLGLIAGFSSYNFRYELGFKKPNFKAGDCVSREIVREFSSETIVQRIEAVGKKKYLTRFYSEKYGEYSTQTWEDRIDDTDTNYKLINCP